MTQTIKKHIGEGFGKGELYAALAYDENDVFGGMRIKGLYIAAPTTAITASTAIKVISIFTGNGYHHTGYFESQYTGAGVTYGTIRAVVGVGDLSGIQTDHSNAQYIVGVHGRAKVSGTAYNGGLFVTGVHAQILAGGTYTKVSHVSSLWADNQLTTVPTSGEFELLYLSNNGGSAAMGQAIYAYVPYVTNLLKIYGGTVGGMISATIGATGIHKTIVRKIKISIDGVTYYLLASTAPAAS